jgi:peptidoglycan hydrolase-like protein with peptidoglycan-binding domain
MKPRTATHLALALLVAAGPGVSAARTAGSQAAPSTKKKPTAARKTGQTATTSTQGSTHKSSTKKSSKKSGKRPTNSRGKGQKAPTADRVTEIQQALAKDGSFNGTPNGKWDDGTVSAMKKYQQAHGLNPSGKLDAKTLQQLGLGSQTAGVAAPMPPVSSSSTSARSKTIAQQRQP